MRTPRSTRLPAIGIVIPSMMMTACAPSPFDGSLTDLAEHDLAALETQDRALLARAERRPHAGAAARPSHAPPPGEAAPDAITAPPGEAATDSIPPAATPEDYVRLALERNPTIHAARQRVLRLHERIAQVTSLDDPMLEVVPIGEMAETAAGEVALMTGVSQRLPFPGKLDVRGRVAAGDVAEAEQDLERVRLSVIGDTRRAYWSLYYAARAIEVTSRSRELLSQLLEVAQAKYRAGTTTQEAVLRASVELNNLDNELITLEQRRTTAAGMLNMLIDRSVAAPLGDPAPVELSGFEARLDDLLASAERTNPSIRAIRERIDRFHEERELARYGRYPDLTVSASWNLVDAQGLSPVANGRDQWWVGFGVNLPIWAGRLDAAEREATRGILESAGQLAGEQNRVAFRVQDAFVKVESQQRQALLLRDVIVPEARQTVEASLSGYRAGALDFLTLVDNWRKLLDFQLMYQASITELERSFAELQEAVGHDLERGGPTGALESRSDLPRRAAKGRGGGREEGRAGSVGMRPADHSTAGSGEVGEHGRSRGDEPVTEYGR